MDATVSMVSSGISSEICFVEALKRCTIMNKNITSKSTINTITNMNTNDMNKETCTTDEDLPYIIQTLKMFNTYAENVFDAASINKLAAHTAAMHGKIEWKSNTAAHQSDGEKQNNLKQMLLDAAIKCCISRSNALECFKKTSDGHNHKLGTSKVSKKLIVELLTFIKIMIRTRAGLDGINNRSFLRVLLKLANYRHQKNCLDDLQIATEALRILLNLLVVDRQRVLELLDVDESSMSLDGDNEEPLTRLLICDAAECLIVYETNFIEIAKAVDEQMKTTNTPPTFYLNSKDEAAYKAPEYRSDQCDIHKNSCSNALASKAEYLVTLDSLYRPLDHAQYAFNFTLVRVLFFLTLKSELGVALAASNICSLLVKLYAIQFLSEHLQPAGSNIDNRDIYYARKLQIEILRVLTNMSMNPTSKAAVCAVDAETLLIFGYTISAALAAFARPSDEVCELFARTYLLPPSSKSSCLSAPAVNFESAASKNSVPQKNAADCYESVHLHSHSKINDPYVKAIFDDWKCDEMERSPARPTLRDLKCDIVNLLVYLSDLLLPNLLVLYYYPLQGIVNIFHQALIAALFTPRDVETILTPIAVCLLCIVTRSSQARHYVNLCIFGQRSLHCAHAALPQCSAPDRQLECDLFSLHELIIKQMTSLNYSVKNAVSELVWEVCEHEANDIIRLVGFGNAAGLLVDKGLPGFESLNEQTLK